MHQGSQTYRLHKGQLASPRSSKLFPRLARPAAVIAYTTLFVASILAASPTRPAAADTTATTAVTVLRPVSTSDPNAGNYIQFTFVTNNVGVTPTIVARKLDPLDPFACCTSGNIVNFDGRTGHGYLFVPGSDVVDPNGSRWQLWADDPELGAPGTLDPGELPSHAVVRWTFLTSPPASSVTQFLTPITPSFPSTPTSLRLLTLHGDGSPFFGEVRYRVSRDPAVVSEINATSGWSTAFSSYPTPGVPEITVEAGNAPLYVIAFADELITGQRGIRDPGELVGVAAVVPATAPSGTVLAFTGVPPAAPVGTTVNLPVMARTHAGVPFQGTIRYGVAHASSGNVSFTEQTMTSASGNGSISVVVTDQPQRVVAFADDPATGTSTSLGIGEVPGATAVVPLPPVTGGTYPSDECVGGQVADGFVADTYLKLRVQQLSDRVRVCVRGDAAAGALGGKFEVTSGSVNPSTPTTEATHTTCEAVNGRPAMVTGEWSEAGQPDHLPYLLDSYSTTGQAGVCVRFGAVSRHVNVPIGGITPASPTFVPDPPGRHVPSPTAAQSKPSAVCQNSTTGTKDQLFNGTSGGTQAWIYTWRESATRVHACVRASGVASAGGLLTVDTSKGSGAVPSATTEDDLTGCTTQQFQTTSPAFVRISRSNPGSLPAAVCLQVGSAVIRVTVATGATNPADTVSFTVDP